MTFSNLALVFSPNILKRKYSNKLDQTELETYLKETPLTNNFMLFLIENYKKIFKEEEEIIKFEIFKRDKDLLLKQIKNSKTENSKNENITNNKAGFFFININIEYLLILY
jgi:hypothetical protein